jgi:large subunit ribosomal protein L5
MKKQRLSLKQKYEQEVVLQLQKEFEIKNKMAVPKITKVIVNMGTGEKLRNKESKEELVRDLAAMTGQRPSVRPAKISVAGFSIREGMPVGLKATLRGQRMYDFLQKLFLIVLPRLRDFRGLSLKSFDGQANYTLGLSEYTVFPEVSLSKTSGSQGLEITVVTNTQDIRKSKKLLELLGMPFEKEE